MTLLTRSAFALVSGLCVTAHSASASPAQAEAESQASADIITVKACLQTRKEQWRRATCIGTITEACRSEPSVDPVSIQTYFCMEREFEAWDALLNENYTAQLRTIEDQETGDASVKRDQLDALRSAQRLWVQFRDAEMERERANSHGAMSTWITSNVAKIKLEMTARRAIDLD